MNDWTHCKGCTDLKGCEANGCLKEATALPEDWFEDLRHENGNYECICGSCGVHFRGHKRRVDCKVCANKA
ncbi:MAG: hypothetical protein KAI73_09150 [Rhodospirillaceae bacterium]|nr:hypothetical protein [Rhodospirillaceae bacterium]